MKCFTIEQESKLASWLAGMKFDKSTGVFADTLSLGFSFPLSRNQTVIAHKPFRANRYIKRGSLLRFAGLAAYCTLFLNEHDQFIRVQHNQLQNFVPCAS